MKENSIILCFRNFTACCLMLAVFVASSMVAFAMPDNKSATGELIVSGHNSGGGAPFVMLNGERAFSGRTFFSSGTIATSESNNATVKLGKLGYINVAPNSVFSLSFGENTISGNLTAGQIKIFSSEGVEVKIQTVNQVVANDASQNDVFTVAVESETTNAVAEAGSIHLNDGQAIIPASNQQQTPPASEASIVPLVLVFSGIVAVAFVYAVRNGNNNNNNNSVVSPIR